LYKNIPENGGNNFYLFILFNDFLGRVFLNEGERYLELIFD